VVEEFPAVDIKTPSTGSDFFNDLDTDIRRVSEPLLKGGHFADSVLAAFRELNHQVKQEYKRRKNAGLDGAELMHTAFSLKNPVFVLADQSTESGRNIQQGFMELFAGSMIGIRNPHAHENLSLDRNEALRLFGQSPDEEIQNRSMTFSSNEIVLPISTIAGA
jgi:uncharacterized protein (TIGR02391 family)